MPCPTQLVKLDDRRIPSGGTEIRSFTCLKNEMMRLPYFLDYYRNMGVDRFFFIDNASTDGTSDFLLEQSDCHCFFSDGNHFEENIEPPQWLNALANVFGDRHWCLTLDADELFVYPYCEKVSLRALCQYLDDSGCDALPALMLDMYGGGPIAETRYEKGRSFLDACPFFDPTLGWTQMVEGVYPSRLMFGGVRERALWHGRHKAKRPPCITKVPLVKWQKGTRYIAASHVLAYARLAPLRSVLLHFKFLSGFYESSAASLSDNKEIRGKTLEERASYVDSMVNNPKLALWNSNSVRYHDSLQLIDLGWMQTSTAYDQFARSQAELSAQIAAGR